MSQAGTRPWWADVQHLREPVEARRGAQARRGVAQDATAERRGHLEAAPPRECPGSAPTHERPLRPRSAAPGPRRTVVIRGHAIPAVTAPRLIEVERRRPGRRAPEPQPGRPDRVALWAVGLGALLMTVAGLSGHA